MQSYQNPPPPGLPGQGGYQSMPQPPPQPQSSIYMGTPERSLFNNKQIRADFISKVYTILFFQLLFATALIAWFTLHKPTHDYMQVNGAIYLYVAFGAGLVTFLILACVESTRRSFPLNFILLSVVTVAFGLMAAIAAARYDTITVLCAAGATALSTFVIIILAKYSPLDVTGCGCALCVIAIIHMFAALILTLVLVPAGYATTASLIIAGFGAFLVSLYMLFDLQLIMGGRSNELSPEEYIVAALLLYIDILNLFQYLLILFAARD